MHHFFAYLSRLKHINRWNLMRNVRQENVMEHTCEVAMIAHGLTLIQNARYGGALDPQRARCWRCIMKRARSLRGIW
jgi:5'-deoxynucleotidase